MLYNSKINGEKIHRFFTWIIMLLMLIICVTLNVPTFYHDTVGLAAEFDAKFRQLFVSDANFLIVFMSASNAAVN